MAAKPRRAVMLGLDAMVPNMVERFLQEGELPHLARLVERGCFSRIMPAIPAQTPSNWTTLATGATPGGHGIVQWGSHLPGEPVWEYHRTEAFSAGLCRAEYLWEAAARAGRRSVVMNYAGYPPTTDQACFIDWLYEPSRSYFDLAAASVHGNCADLPGAEPLLPQPAHDWRNLPPATAPLLAAELPVRPATAGDGPVYHLLLSGAGELHDRALICTERDCATAVADLRPGEWSAWLRATFEPEGQGSVEGALRFKLLEPAGEASRARILCTDAFPTDASFCSNAQVASRLARDLGPYLHSAQACELHCRGLLDFETVDELMRWETDWWSRAAEIAMEETGASLLVLHWHILDAMGHRFVPGVDPTGSEYDAAAADARWEVIRAYYRAADRFVGAFLNRLDDGETAFAVVSDHGMPANAKAVSLVNLFLERGWITPSADGRGVDWTRSRVFFAQNHLWVNLRGRDAGGIVDAIDYDPLRRQVLAALRDLKDADTGEHVLAFALPREEAAVVGLWGEYIGDIVFCYAGGYRWSGPEVLGLGERRPVFPCGGGNHGPMIPTYETATTSVLGALILAGPGVRSARARARLDQLSVRATDLAPTLAHLLGLPTPAQNEGRVLGEFLQDHDCSAPVRRLQSLSRPVVRRRAAAPKAKGLQGDVTDEA